MATNRTRRTRKVAAISLASFTFAERYSFMRAWYPRVSVPTRWKTWEEYFSDYDSVRDELLADEETRRVSSGPPFADRVRTDLKGGEVYDGHDHLGLRHDHAYVRGDGHTHADIAPRNVPAKEMGE